MRNWIFPALIGTFCAVACAAAEGPDADKKDPVTPGEAMFNSNCTMCHGRDGRLNLSGAKDLTKSVLTKAEMIAIVTSGKGDMAGFGRTLTKKQVEEVVNHVRSLHVADGMERR